MRIVRLIVENQPVPPALLKHSGFGLLVMALAINRPMVEAAGAPVDFAEDQRNDFVGIWRRAAIAEDGVIPGLFLGLDPTRRAGLVRLFNNAHAVPAILVYGSS